MSSPPPPPKSNAQVILERTKKLLESAQVLLQPAPPRSQGPSRHVWHPSSGVDTQHQDMMIFYNEHWGLRGLNRYLCDHAEAVIEELETTDHSYQRIYNDFARSAKSAEAILATVHPDTLLSVLKGDFFYRQSQDSEFRSRVEHTTALAPVPDVYLVGWARNGSDKNHAGKGVSLRELANVHGHMTRYVDLADTAFQSTAKEIDGAIPIRDCQSRDYDYDRRYRYFRSGQATFEAVEEWLTVTQEAYLDRVKDWPAQVQPDGWSLDEPMARVLVYCGWGVLTLNRAQSHQSHPISESPLYGLFSATLMYLYGDQFEFRGMQLFRCYDKRDAAMCEILGHEISSSRMADTGLNGAAPGGVGSNNINLGGDGMELVWQRNRDFIDATGLVKQNLALSLEKYARTRKLINAMPTIDAEQARIKREARELYEKIEATAKEAETFAILKAIEEFDDFTEEFERSCNIGGQKSDS